MRKILKLERHSPQREFEFDLDYLLSLTSQERFAILLRHSTEAVTRLIEHGYCRPTEIIKRPARPLRHHRRNRVSDPRIRAHDR